MSQLSARAQIIQTLLLIQEGQSLSQLLEPLLDTVAAEDKAFVHALLLTTLRHWHALARLVDSLADKPIDELPVRTALQLGFCQLLYMNVADHAAIHETVEAVKEVDYARAAGLVNAVLRKVSKNPNKYRKKVNKNHSLPNWLAKQLKQDWPEQYDELTQGLRQTAPMFLRVNEQQTTTTDYVQRLHMVGIEAKEMAFATILEFAKDLDAAVNKSNEADVKGLSDIGEGKTVAISRPLRLNHSSVVTLLPEFATGMVSVQDAHAQLAAPIIQLAVEAGVKNKNFVTRVDDDSHAEQPKIQLLDACAAPGGKLLHWLQLMDKKGTMAEQDLMFHVKQDAGQGIEQPKLSADPKVSETKMGDDVSNDSSNSQAKKIDSKSLTVKVAMTAIDNEPSRILRIVENLQRSGYSEDDVTIQCVDARTWQMKPQPNSQSEQKPQFDAILLDAPCTATGVIRRHPDIGLLRQESDVAATVALQASILENLWQQLKVGGCLLYVTCSILKAENEGQMQAFLQAHADAQEIGLQADWGIAQSVGRQCLPVASAENTESTESGDGFYYALLTKTAAMC